jgi:hypothetical protein
VIPELRYSPLAGGIIVRKVFERLELFIEQMNGQATELDEWRKKIIHRLRLPLLDQSGNPEGE